MNTSRKIRFLLLITAVALAGTASVGAPAAFALTALKQVQVSNGSRVDLLFDGKISRSQIKTEFFRDIIQISLSDVSVYPAKISSVSGGVLTKVFAYQYAPRLVRCRISIKGSAESYKNKLVLSPGGPGGKMLTVRLGDAAAVRDGSVSIRDPGEQALLERVMKAKDPASQPMAAPAHAPKDAVDTITEKAAAPAKGIGAPPSGSEVTNTEDRPLNLDMDSGHRSGNQLGGKAELPSPLSALGKLALVIGLFSLIALGAKKFWKPGEKSHEDNPVLGAIGRFARKGLGAKSPGSRKIAIEVLANHHLGPKKSIAVIKVSGHTMVVGITEQAINLISRLSSEPGLASDEDAMNALAELDSPPLDDAPRSSSSAGPDVFSSLLQSEAAKPAINTPVANTKMAATTVNRQPALDARVVSYGGSTSPATQPVVSAQAARSLSGVRAQIRSKLEGLKQI